MEHHARGRTQQCAENLAPILVQKSNPAAARGAALTSICCKLEHHRALHWTFSTFQSERVDSSQADKPQHAQLSFLDGCHYPQQAALLVFPPPHHLCQEDRRAAVSGTTEGHVD